MTRRKIVWVSFVIDLYSYVLSWRFSLISPDGKNNSLILHGNHHFEKNRFHRFNFYIIFCYSDTIGLLEFYFDLSFFFSSSYSSFYVSPPSRWETINLEYLACWKTNRMKNISLHDNVLRVFFRVRGNKVGFQDASWNIRWVVLLRAFRPPVAEVLDVSKSL